MVTDNQVLALWKEFRKSKVIKIAALKTGMDRKTAAKYLNQNILPSEKINLMIVKEIILIDEER